MRYRFFIICLAMGLAAFLSLGAASATKTDDGKNKVSSQLRKDWKLNDLQTMKKAVQGASFPQDIRKSAIEAIDSYLADQEKLIDKADTQKDNGAAAKKAKASLETEFQKKMKAINSNPEYKAELEKRIKAMKDQMDSDADKASDMFEKVNSGKSTTKPSKESAATSKSTSTKAK